MQEAALMVDIPRAVSDSFEQVVRQRESQVLRIAYRMLGNWADAEDVAQEAFLRLHRRGLDFAHEGACAAWLYRVTVNLCVDRVRSRKPATELFPEIASGAGSAEQDAIREQEKARLMAALAQLPPRERAAVILREIEGLSSEEAAAIPGS